MPHTPPLIVVANDNRMYLELLMDVLREAGYQITIADSGPSAHQLIAKKHADLAVIDMSIAHPDTALMTVTMLRTDVTTYHIPIILCAVVSDAIHQHADHFLQLNCRLLAKPYTIDALLDIIQSVLPIETVA